MTIKEMNIGDTARVTVVGGEGALRQHFLDMGVIPGVEITLVKYAPMGDPIQLRVHGYELTLRLADADKIQVMLLSKDRIREQKPSGGTAGAEGGASGSGRDRQIPCQGGRDAAAGGTDADICARRQSELRQDHAV